MVNIQEFKDTFHGDHISNYFRHIPIEKQGDVYLGVQATICAAFSTGVNQSIYSEVSEQLDLIGEHNVQHEFMNYGITQLVYLSIIEDRSVATLINQPGINEMDVYQEFTKITRLREIDKRHITNPIAYFYFKETGYGLYVAEHIEGARCVAVLKGNQGAYTAFPGYSFEKFNPDTRSAINSGIIALLVNYHDENHQSGISRVRTDGDDFVLRKGFDIQKPESVLPNMVIIGARESLDCTLDEYVDLLHEEFRWDTNPDQQRVIDGTVKINTSSRMTMSKKEIETGIEWGMDLRKEKSRPFI